MKLARLIPKYQRRAERYIRMMFAARPDHEVITKNQYNGRATALAKQGLAQPIAEGNQKHMIITQNVIDDVSASIFDNWFSGFPFQNHIYIMFGGPF